MSTRTVAVPPPERTRAGPILLVEDDHETRLLVSLVLSHAGHQVITAHDGQQALDVLDRGIRPQVMIVDLMLPMVDGAAVLRRVGNDPALGGVLTIAVSGDESGLKHARAHATFLKPLDPDTLVDCVSALIRSRAGTA